MENENKNKKGTFLQFIKFGLVGVFNTLVNQIIFMVLVNLGLHYIVASIIGFIISVLNAYFWQTRFVFKEDKTAEKRVWWQVLLKTYAAYAFTGLLLNNLLLILWIDVIKIEQLTPPLTGFVNNIGINIDNRELATDIAPLLNMVVNVPINFLINKFWAYRQRKRSS